MKEDLKNKIVFNKLLNIVAEGTRRTVQTIDTSTILAEHMKLVPDDKYHYNSWRTMNSSGYIDKIAMKIYVTKLIKQSEMNAYLTDIKPEPDSNKDIAGTVLG